jgi:hypothetical protein
MKTERGKLFGRIYATDGPPSFMIENLSQKILYFKLDKKGRKPIITTKAQGMFVLDHQGAIFYHNFLPI